MTDVPAVSHETRFADFLVDLVDAGDPEAIRRTPKFLDPGNTLEHAIGALAILAERNQPQTEGEPR